MERGWRLVLRFIGFALVVAGIAGTYLGQQEINHRLTVLEVHKEALGADNSTHTSEIAQLKEQVYDLTTRLEMVEYSLNRQR